MTRILVIFRKPTGSGQGQRSFKVAHRLNSGATCTTRWPMARQRMMNIWCTLRLTCNPVQSYKPISSTDAARLHQFGATMLPVICMGFVLRAGGGWSGDLPIADREDLENFVYLRKSTRSGSSTKKAHKRDSCYFHVQTDLSNSPTRRNAPPVENPEQD